VLDTGETAHCQRDDLGLLGAWVDSAETCRLPPRLVATSSCQTSVLAEELCMRPPRCPPIFLPTGPRSPPASRRIAWAREVDRLRSPVAAPVAERFYATADRNGCRCLHCSPAGYCLRPLAVDGASPADPPGRRCDLRTGRWPTRPGQFLCSGRCRRDARAGLRPRHLGLAGGATDHRHALHRAQRARSNSTSRSIEARLQVTVGYRERSTACTCWR